VSAAQWAEESKAIQNNNVKVDVIFISGSDVRGHKVMKKPSYRKEKN
jgi:hypothetical protein